MTFDTLIDEPIKVWAFFDPSTSSGQIADIFPIAMNWRRRFVKFEKLIFSTTRSTGEVKMIRLVCASETATFELEFNAATYSWKLKKVMESESS